MTELASEHADGQVAGDWPEMGYAGRVGVLGIDEELKRLKSQHITINTQILKCASRTGKSTLGNCCLVSLYIPAVSPRAAEHFIEKRYIRGEGC